MRSPIRCLHMVTECVGAVKIIDSTIITPIGIHREFHFASGVRQIAAQHVTEVLASNAPPPHIATRAKRLVARGDADERHIGCCGILRWRRGEHFDLLDARCLQVFQLHGDGLVGHLQQAAVNDISHRRLAGNGHGIALDGHARNPVQHLNAVQPFGERIVLGEIDDAVGFLFKHCAVTNHHHFVQFEHLIPIVGDGINACRFVFFLCKKAHREQSHQYDGFHRFVHNELFISYLNAFSLPCIKKNAPPCLSRCRPM